MKNVAGHESLGSLCPHPNPGSKIALKVSLMLEGKKTREDSPPGNGQLQSNTTTST